MTKKKFKILVIPDVHGREFWREPVKYTLENPDARIVFLGDYLDCYSHEFDESVDYEQQAIERFKEIIELKKQHINKIRLLLGNHKENFVF